LVPSRDPHFPMSPAVLPVRLFAAKNAVYKDRKLPGI